jgi:formiminotetrahydrofolate cyclodeaminase
MLMDMTVREFLDLLSSDAPAPGGGSVAALSGTIAAALLAMVCRLSIGRDEYREYGDELRSVLEKAEEIQSELSELVDRDTNAFDQVMAAYRLPKTTKQERSLRNKAIQKAFRTATEVPLAVAKHCCTLLRLAVKIARKSNKNAISDLGVSGQCSYGATLGGLMNVKINVPGIKNEAYTSKIISEIDNIQEKVESLKLQLDRAIETILSQNN